MYCLSTLLTGGQTHRQTDKRTNCTVQCIVSQRMTPLRKCRIRKNGCVNNLHHKIITVQCRAFFCSAWKWKLPTTLEQDWEPSTVHRAATTLRRALLTQPLPSEIAMVAEDEKLAKNEKGMMKREGDDDDELEQGTVADSDRFKKPSWEDIIGTNLTFKEEVGSHQLLNYSYIVGSNFQLT